MTRPAPPPPCQGTPEVIGKAIREAFTALECCHLHWLDPRPETSPPLHARVTGRPRLTIVTAGERRVRAPIAGRVEILNLRPGMVLVVPADGWSQVLPGPPNRIIAINCHDTGTHFEAPLAPSRTGASASFVSAAPLNPVAWSLLQALVHLATSPSQRDLAPHVLSLTVEAALADCRAWPEADLGRLAWTRAVGYAREHLSVGREQLAAIAGVHPNHLSRLCRRMEGTSLWSWMSELRMERARHLLAAGLPIDQVAADSGYGELSHFRRTFKRRHGMPPGAWPGIR